MVKDPAGGIGAQALEYKGQQTLILRPVLREILVVCQGKMFVDILLMEHPGNAGQSGAELEQRPDVLKVR